MRNFVKNNKDEFLFGIFFFAQALNLIPKPYSSASYVTFQYMLCYQYGFIGRGFIGTFIYYLGYMSEAKLYFVFLTATAVLTLVCLFFYHYMLSNCNMEQKNVIRAVLWTTAFMPSSICMYYRFLGGLDIYLIMISFLIAWIVCAKKNLWLIVPLCMLEVLIYPGAVFMYFLATEAMLLFLSVNDVKNSKLVFWVNSFSVGSLFLYFMLVPPYLTMTTEAIKSSMISRTSVDISEWISLIDLWFGDKQGNIGTEYIFSGSFKGLVSYFIVMSPLIFFIMKFLSQYFNAKDKFYTFLLTLLPLGYLPYAIMEYDHGRLTGSFLWGMFLLVLVILKTDERATAIASDIVLKYKLKENKYILWIYLLVIGTSHETFITVLTARLGTLLFCML